MQILFMQIVQVKYLLHNLYYLKSYTTLELKKKFNAKMYKKIEFLEAHFDRV